MPDKPTIELPRLPEESARAYAARVEYVTMGPQRSQEAVSQRLGKSRQLMYRWATRHDWAGSARQYDEQVSYLSVQEAADKYLIELSDYRKRYGEMGKALYGSAAKMLKKINKMLDSVEAISPGSLLTVINAAKTAADLEALALRVEHLLNNDEPRSE
jgi:hypothetical protein